jgi:hypothetical protein
VTHIQSGLAPTDPAAAVIVALGLTAPAEVRAVFDHAAQLIAYQWVCGDGHKAADVARVLPLTEASADRLVEVFGEERWGEVDEAIFDATKALVAWSAERPLAAPELAHVPKAA